MYRWFSYDSMEHWLSAAIRLFCLSHLCNQFFSNYCGAMTISWQICLLFGHIFVDGICRFINTSLHMSSFGSAGRFCIFSLFVKKMVPWICCVFHGNHKCTVVVGPDAPLTCLKQGACSLLVFAQLLQVFCR